MSIITTVTHISVIIVHYNSDEQTLDCLRSLEKVKLEGATFSVIVVDNASPKELVVPVSLLEKKLVVLRSESNLGFTGGNNMGIHYAIERHNSEAIILLNSDTIVDPDCFQKLFNHSNTFQKAGMICPKIYFAPGREYHAQSYTKDMLGNVLWYAGGSLDWQHLVAFHRGVDELDQGQFLLQQKSDFATGCCVYIKREVLEKIGLLDKRYFLYLEDVDLSMSAQLFGYEIHYVDAAKVWHVNAGSSKGAGSIIHTYYQTRNRLLFFFLYGDLRVRITVLRLALRYLLTGTRFERLAVLHCITGQLGKQPIV